jgi:protein SCO1/2
MKTLIAFTLVFLLFGNVNGQIPVNREVEVGIIEKLGDTMPLDLTFYNEKNDTVTFGSLITKPTILSFVYFDCPGLCSPLLDGIADVVSKMDLALGKDYNMVTISFNTKDTPEKARIKKLNFIQKIKEKDRVNWTYLTGDLENIQKITDAAGFRFKPTGLDFAHPATIIVLSPKGKITRYLYGVTFLPFDVKMAILESQQGLARPTRSKILQYCFGYDTVTRSYTLQFTRLVGTFMLIAAAFFFFFIFLSSRKKPSKATIE